MSLAYASSSPAAPCSSLTMGLAVFCFASAFHATTNRSTCDFGPSPAAELAAAWPLEAPALVRSPEVAAAPDARPLACSIPFCGSHQGLQGHGARQKHCATLPARAVRQAPCCVDSPVRCLAWAAANQQGGHIHRGQWSNLRTLALAPPLLPRFAIARGPGWTRGWPGHRYADASNAACLVVMQKRSISNADTGCQPGACMGMLSKNSGP